jgi:hypothetical protein
MFSSLLSNHQVCSCFTFLLSFHQVCPRFTFLLSFSPILLLIHFVAFVSPILLLCTVFLLQRRVVVMVCTTWVTKGTLAGILLGSLLGAIGLFLQRSQLLPIPQRPTPISHKFPKYNPTEPILASENDDSHPSLNRKDFPTKHANLKRNSRAVSLDTHTDARPIITCSENHKKLICLGCRFMLTSKIIPVR